MNSMLEKYDKYVVIEREEKTKQIKFYRGKIEVAKEWNDRNVDLFLYRDGKLVNLSIENPGEDKMKKAMEKAEKILSHLSPSPFEIGTGKNYRNEKIFDRNILDEEKMKDRVEASITEGMKYGKEVAGVMYASLEKIRVENSLGVEMADENSSSYLSIRVFSENSSGHAVSCSRSMGGIDEMVGKEAGEMASASKNAGIIEEGKYDVILAPMAFANIISNFGEFSSALAVDAGYSFLKGKVGKKVCSENISIYDSGVERDGIFSRKFDDEGVATGLNEIVKNGVLQRYLHNGTTAALHGERSTGNAGIISPHPWNLIVEGKKENLEKMIEEMGKGIIIGNVWYTRFHNYARGDFSTVVRDGAVMIENGEMKHGVKGIRVNDNMERMLKNIESISRESRQIYWWETEYPVFAPHALIRGVNITTA